MRAWQRLWLIAVLICAVARASAEGSTPASERSPRIGAAAENNRAFFGILGQVARPGVYRFRDGSISLRDLIEEAGGLTVNATGNIRIIRGGRAGLQTFYSPTTVYELQAGDVVVASERTTEYARQNSRSASGRNRSPEAIQVALVNLINRPVVLKVSRSFATVRGIVSSLGQQADSIADVLEPPTTRMTRSASGSGDILPTETVLVFDPRAVDHDRLPQKLPKPYLVGPSSSESVAEEPQNPSLANERSAATPALPFERSVPQDSFPPRNEPGPSFHAGSENLSIPTSLGNHVSRTSMESSPETAIAADADSDAESLHRPPGTETRSSNDAESPLNEPKSESHQESETHQKVVSETDASRPNGALTDLANSGDRRQDARRPVLLAAMLVIGLFLVGAVIVRLLGRRESLPVIVDEPPGPEPVRNPLEDLIQDELPIVEEHVRLPASVTLYGHPKKMAPVRLDAPQARAVNPPHRVPVSGAPFARSEEFSEKSAAPSVPSPPKAGKRHRVDASRESESVAPITDDAIQAPDPKIGTKGGAPSRTSVFERALLRVHGDSSR